LGPPHFVEAGFPFLASLHIALGFRPRYGASDLAPCYLKQLDTDWHPFRGAAIRFRMHKLRDRKFSRNVLRLKLLAISKLRNEFISPIMRRADLAHLALMGFSLLARFVSNPARYFETMLGPIGHRPSSTTFLSGLNPKLGACLRMVSVM